MGKESSTLKEFIKDNCYEIDGQIQWNWIEGHVAPMTKELLKELRDIVND